VNGWIPNLAPTYVATLPHDALTGKTNPNSTVAFCQNNSGMTSYFYRSDGVVYKVEADCLPEGAILASDPFNDPVGPSHAFSVYTPGARNW
jgi:hypothetical protein